VWECGEGQTDTQTRVTNTHFASVTPQRVSTLVRLVVDLLYNMLYNKIHKWSLAAFILYEYVYALTHA